jgi:hypothetical protein
MNNLTIYTNGQSLFTLESFGKTAGVCHEHGITIHSEVSQSNARAMHSKGSLFYIFGIADRKALSGIRLTKKTSVKGFKIS